jgi:hypothetical protein
MPKVKELMVYRRVSDIKLVLVSFEPIEEEMTVHLRVLAKCRK